MSRSKSLLFTILVLVMLAVSPARALAEGGGGGHSFSSDYYGYGVVLGPISYERDAVTGAHKVGYVVYARNRYDAACYVLGMQPSDVSSITSEQRAKLSNESTGGDYWSFAQRAYQFGSGGIPAWVPVGTNLSSLFTQSDDGKVWALDGFVGAPFGTDYEEAKEDLQSILDGQDIGGGGGGGAVSGDYYEFSTGISYFANADYSDYYITGTDGKRYTNVYLATSNSNYELLPTDVRLRIPISCLESLNSYFPFEDNNWYAYVGVFAGKLNFVIVAGNTLSEQTATQTLTNNNLPTFTNSYLKQLTYTYQSIRQSQQSSYVDTYTYENGVITYTGNSVYSAQLWANGNSFWLAPQLGGFYLRSVDSAPVTPPTNWPDEEPTEPTEPTVPGPGNTTITGPTYINKPTYVTNTFTADFQGLLDALDEHCQHLQDSMYQNFKSTFEGMTDYLGDEFDSLKQYLHDLFEWLADEIEHTISGGGYSDSTVVSWLKKIWSKIGSGVSTRPVDPVSDTDGAWDWLMSLFAGFLASLAEKGLQLSGALHGLLDDLVEKFPFSVPWDILALLALFTADPVTPAVDFDMHLLGDMVVSVDIDLSDYDSLMATVRPVELIAFAAWLLWLTPEVLKSLNVSIGGGD